MESVIPQRERVESILEQLDAWIPDFDADSVVTGLAMVEFAMRVAAAADAHFGRYGLSQGRFTVLMFLFHFPETTWTPAALAEASGVRRATMTGLLQKLERDGWVERTPHPEDGRRALIAFSEEGRRRFTKLLPDHFARWRRALADVSASDHRAFRRLAEAMGARLEGLAESPP